jgi:HD-GYP domain-containing protein (c-di-GMP phosphodiesterase class II)
VLLLAEGSRITAEFKRRLLTREIMTVRVHQLDSGEPIPEPEEEVVPTPDPWGPDVTVGVPFVTNRGPALRARITRLGARAVDQQFLATLRQEQTGTANLLDQFMNRAEGGREQSAGQLLESIDRAVERLAVDVDAFTGLAISATQPRSLSQHCRDLAHLSMTMATELGLNSENVSKIGVTALLHDWGWLRVPLEIRQLTRPPTRMEMLEIHKHPAYSLDMLEKLNGLPSLIGLVSYQIHEKLDGTGYPRAKSGRNIHLFARIIHVADDYLTLTGATLFRAPLHPSIAMRVLLEQQDGRAADRNVLRALLRALSIFPIGSQVRLSDDTIATVLRGARGELLPRGVPPLVERWEGRAQSFGAFSTTTYAAYASGRVG